MGCSGDREKGNAVTMEEQWDYVNLNDFKSDSCWAGFSYFFLWVFLIVSFAVYGVDTFTAVNLLAFSRWSGRVEPAIPFRISRWIFAACILTSFALLIYRWILAIRAIRSGSITRSYLDPLAVRVQSFRVFTKEGNGWKRFLVFAELTKSKKGAEYVALYTYFSFQFWMNTIFADGPRQVINAITLYSVMKLDLLPGGANTTLDKDTSPILQFFNNIKILAEENNLQAVVLFGMLFTLIIWVLSVLKLASAVILYLVFLFHHIPEEDGTLKAYCRRKISTRLKRIVQRKVNKALAKGFQLQDRAPTQPTFASRDTKPTLPDLNKGPIVTSLSRSTTETTLPPYTRTNPNTTETNPTLPNLEFDNKPPLTRTATQSSAMSESAFLTGNAAGMGYSPLDRQASPLPPVPPLPTVVPPARTGTAMSRSTPGPTSGPTPLNNDSSRGTPVSGYRSLTDSEAQPYRTFTPANDPYARSGTPGDPVYAYRGPSHASAANPYARPNMPPAPAADDYFARSHTPATDPYAQSNIPEAPVIDYGRSHTPFAEDYDQYNSQGAPVTGSYYGHSHSPDIDPYSRSHTPGAAVVDEYYDHEHAAAADSYGRSKTPDGFYGHSDAPSRYSPYSAQDNIYGAESGQGISTYDHGHDQYREQPGTPANQFSSQPAKQPQDGYRSYTPVSTGAQPPPIGPSGRSFTPVSYGGTPVPQPGAQVQPPPRTFAPMSPESPVGSQNGGYAAFNTPMASQTPQPHMQRATPPTGYQPFNRANTASPSTMHRNGPPGGHSFNRANTHQY
ncbi:hypothetical protein N7523_002649 [Penicillium sp. IBT 18751x]|nr:hypothetical protein N7523_002649 [Penicillium sp. IBT 18751x]